MVGAGFELRVSRFQVRRPNHSATLPLTNKRSIKEMWSPLIKPQWNWCPRAYRFQLIPFQAWNFRFLLSLLRLKPWDWKCNMFLDGLNKLYSSGVQVASHDFRFWFKTIWLLRQNNSMTCPQQHASPTITRVCSILSWDKLVKLQIHYQND